MQERPSVSHRSVFTGLFVSLVLACSFSVFVYYRYIRYVPRARAWLPPEAELSASIQVEQGIVYEPFRRHFFPLLEKGRKGPESRLLHLERKTTLELGVDTRELAFAFLPDQGWSVVVGGLFRQDGVVLGASRMLLEEGLTSFTSPEPTSGSPSTSGSSGATVVAPGLPAPEVARLGRRAFFSSPASGILVLASSQEGMSSPSGGAPAVPRTRVLEIRLRPGPGAKALTQSGSILLEVDLAEDFPFVLRGLGDLDRARLEARLSNAFVAPRPQLLAALRSANVGEPAAILVGRLGRYGFDELLAELAAQLEARIAPAFDR